MTPDAVAAALLEHSRLRPTDPEERARLIAGYPAMRTMAGQLWELPLGDLAPWPLPTDA